MKVDTRFPRQVLMVLLIGLLCGVGVLAVVHLVSRESVIAMVVGAALSTLNVMAGFLAIEYSLEKSYATFLKAVLGGMGIRMAVMLGAIVLLLKFGGLHTAALVVSVLGFYIVFLALEIFYIQKKVSHKHQS